MSPSFAGYYVALLFLSSFICLWLAYRIATTAGRHDSVKPFLYSVLSATFWSLTSAGAAISPNDSVALWFLMVHYVAITVCAGFMLQFALGYTDQVRHFRGPSGVVFVVPGAVLLIILIDPSAFVTSAVFVRSGAFLLIDSYEPHWAYWVSTIYTYTLLGISYCLIVAAVFRSRALYAGQIALVVAGATVMGAVNVFTRADVFRIGLPHLDWSGATLWAACGLWYAAVFNYRLLDVMPLARDVLVERMRDAVLVVDPRGRVVDANPRMRALLQDPEAIGKPVAHVVPRELLPYVAPRAAAEVNEEIGMALPSGVRQFDVQVSALVDDSGEPIGQLVVLQDVTERSRMIRDLDAYARVVAHDLKNPIGVILGYSDILKEESAGLSDEGREFVEAIGITCRRTSKIIEELLLMASLRAEVPDITVLDMAEVVRQARERLAATISASGAEIIAPASWPAALGKPIWVEEVWMNYLSNAIKYGGRPPRIELGALGCESGMERFYVRDNGAGLAEEQHARLFQEFQRFAPEHAEGHGLGLSIVRRLIERLGGTVGATSAPGQGSTFWFKLPSAPALPTRQGRPAIIVT